MEKSIKNKLSLGETQRLFMRFLPLLIQYAYVNGYELTLGDGFRDSRVFGTTAEQKGYGRQESNHKRRLAIDLNLFKDGNYLTDTSDHLFLGEYWESLHPLFSWGGQFKDGNHYSVFYKGHR